MVKNYLDIQKNNFGESILKIADFGTSIEVKNGEILNEIIGSPSYMAPEVYDQKYTFKSDIWSCGIIAYFVFTGGYLPFSGDTTPDIMDKVKNG